jgi:hypothetical protein
MWIVVLTTEKNSFIKFVKTEHFILFFSYQKYKDLEKKKTKAVIVVIRPGHSGVFNEAYNSY